MASPVSTGIVENMLAVPAFYVRMMNTESIRNLACCQETFKQCSVCGPFSPKYRNDFQANGPGFVQTMVGAVNWGFQSCPNCKRGGGLIACKVSFAIISILNIDTKYILYHDKSQCALQIF